MKKFILSALFLFSFVFCFAKDANGYECTKQYTAYDRSYYYIGVAEIPAGILRDNGYQWSIIVEGYDSDNSQGFMTFIYYKQKAAALKEYSRSLTSQNKKTKTFNELIEFYQTPENGFYESIDIDQELNIPKYIFIGYGD